MTRRRLSVLMLALFALAPGALAHWADLSVAEVSTGEREVRMTLTFPTGLAAFADDDRSGALSPAEITRHRGQLQTRLGAKIRVSGDGQPGVLTVGPATGEVKLPSRVEESTHSTLALTYRWPAAVAGFKVHYDLFQPGVNTASCLATVLHDGKVQSVVFTPDSREVSIGREAAPVAFTSFITLGIEHILTGYDHLLFLLALLVLGGGFRQLLKIITAFTVAHSITLALTVLGIVSLPSKIIESGIALSIAYVAVENLVLGDSKAMQRRRWLVTFAFGLLHGMGFADLLGGMNIPRPNLLGALVGFNLGVELGQLTVVVPAFLVLTFLQRWRATIGLRWGASAFAAAAGMFWFVQRAFLTA